MRKSSAVVSGTLVTVLAVLVLSGCYFSDETIGSGESARTWKWGKLTRIYQADFEQVCVAATAAVRELKLKVAKDEHDALVGCIRASRSDGVAVRLDLEKIGKTRARVTVCVGVMGKERDKDCATVVMDTVDEKLGG